MFAYELSLKQSNNLTCFYININVIEAWSCGKTGYGHDITAWRLSENINCEWHILQRWNTIFCTKWKTSLETYRSGRETQPQHSYESLAPKCGSQLAHLLLLDRNWMSIESLQCKLVKICMQQENAWASVQNVIHISQNKQALKSECIEWLTGQVSKAWKFILGHLFLCQLSEVNPFSPINLLADGFNLCTDRQLQVVEELEVFCVGSFTCK